MKSYKKGPRFGPNSHQKMLYKQLLDSSTTQDEVSEVKQQEKVETQKVEKVAIDVQQSQPQKEVDAEVKHSQEEIALPEQKVETVESEKPAEKKKK